MRSRYSFFVIIIVYVIVFTIGLYLILGDKDWRGYVALLSTPFLHTLIKAIDKQLNNTIGSRK
ncbi:MAG: hypothetical protein HY817_03600 [Candidatus Abawacabacteria bacterium]|nr:hypothetical protein [Candidatus Abawacabacteria bacterium]